jgi:Arc/MetJ-type ribon-helix-helix transcriptional regulator
MKRAYKKTRKHYILRLSYILLVIVMSSEIVNFRTTPELIRQIQKLVDSGYYRNRTEAMNDALRLLVRRYMAVRARQKIFKTRRKLGRHKGNLTGALITARKEEW